MNFGYSEVCSGFFNGSMCVATLMISMIHKYEFLLSNSDQMRKSIQNYNISSSLPERYMLLFTLLEKHVCTKELETILWNVLCILECLVYL